MHRSLTLSFPSISLVCEGPQFSRSLGCHSGRHGKPGLAYISGRLGVFGFVCMTPFWATGSFLQSLDHIFFLDIYLAWCSLNFLNLWFSVINSGKLSVTISSSISPVHFSLVSFWHSNSACNSLRFFYGS